MSFQHFRNASQRIYQVLKYSIWSAGILFFVLNQTQALASGFVGEGPKVGQPAPAFKATTLDGKTVQLSDFKGKTVVLEWWNYGCPYVKKHYESGNMQSLQKKYQKKAVWLIVASSAEGKQGHVTAKNAKDHLGSKAAPREVLLDSSGEIGRLYHAKTTPHMFVIDPAGKVIYQGAIDDQPSTRESSLKGAKNYVDLALQQHFSGKKVEVAESRPYGCSVKYKQ